MAAVRYVSVAVLEHPPGMVVLMLAGSNGIFDLALSC
jgi:hypothetical protein